MENKDIILNSEQKACVFAKADTIVTAGAGSGKTTVLAARVLYLLTQHIPLKSILVLTFTNKAVAEMQNRIITYLNLIIEQKFFLGEFLSEQQLEFLQTQREDFDKAQISTIDSFFGIIARFGARDLGYIENITASNSLVEQAQAFVYIYFIKHKTSDILNNLIKINGIDNLINKKFVPFLTEAKIETSHNFMKNTFRDLIAFFCEQRDNLIDKGVCICEFAQKNYYSFLEGIKKKSSENYIQSLYNYTKFFKNVQKNVKDLLIEYSNLEKFKDFRTSKDITGSGFLENLKLIKSELVQITKDLCALGKTIQDETWLLECCDFAQGLLEEWIEHKKKKTLFSYANIAQLAEYALKNVLNAKKWVSTNFLHVIVDEAQDNSLEQQRVILNMFSHIHKDNNIKKSLFFVGDPQQSIYKFRGADVASFLSLQNEKTVHTQKLHYNYRSSHSLITFFNVFFNYAFSQRNSDTYFDTEYNNITYQEQKALEYNKTEQKNQNTDVCVHTLEKTEQGEPSETVNDGADLEAFYIAGLVKDILAQGRYVASDIAILAETKKIFFNLQKAFLIDNISFSVEQKKAGLKQDVGKDFYSWFNLLLFPEDVSAYAAVLRGPIANISDAFVLNLLADRKLQKYEDLSLYNSPFIVPSKLSLNKIFSHDIMRLKILKEKYLQARKFLERGDVQMVLDHFWNNCGYKYIILRNKKHHSFLGQYDILKSIIASYAADGVMDVFHVLQDIILSDLFVDDTPVLLEQNENAVKIMTIHKAKGLEFPIVILCDTNRSFNLKKMYFFGHIKDKPYIDFGSSDDIPKLFKLESAHTEVFTNGITNMLKKVSEKDVSEKLRVLYVACTRAEHKLHIVNHNKQKNDKEKIQKNDHCIEVNAETKELSFVSVAQQPNNQIDFFHFFNEFVEDTYKKTLFETKKVSVEELDQLFSQTSTVRPEEFSVQGEAYIQILSDIISFKKQEVKIDLLKEVNASFLDDFSEDGKKTLTKKLDVDSLLHKKKLYEIFGTLCHFLLKQKCELQTGKLYAKYEPIPVILEKKILDLSLEEKKIFFASAQKCVQNFLQSPAWEKRGVDTKVFCELPFTIWNTKYNVRLNGTIDLVMLSLVKNSKDVYDCHVVDYKTNTYQNPKQYELQLAAYKLGLEKMCKINNNTIFGNKIEKITTGLFYLRNAQFVSVDSYYDEETIYKFLHKK